MRYRFEGFSLDVGRRELLRDGSPVAIEPKVLDLLICLLRNQDRVVSRDDLIEAVWDGRIVSESSLSSCLNAARVALGDSGEQQRLIRTLPRKGFRFVAAIESDDSVATLPAVLRTPLALPERPSIAVLPFQNMSSDPEQEYFADGVVDDIILGLARHPGLFVISRNSSFIYKNRPATVKQVGEELGVRYVLEGSVRKAGQRVRVGAQLIDAESGAHLWVERYDRELGDIFALQDELSASVVTTIEPKMRAAEASRARRRPGSLDAYDLVLRAHPYAHSHLADDAALAIPLLIEALKLEPDYAGAHAPLALCYHSRFSRAGLQEEDRAAAIRHAQAAIACGADDATALGIAGFVLALDAHDRATALKTFDQALALSQSNFFALCSSALALSWMGSADTAIERANRALRLSPFDPLNYLSLNALAISYLHQRRFEQAREAASRSVALNPRFSVSRAFLTAALVELKEASEAASQARELLTLDPKFSIQRFSVTVDIEPTVFAPIARSWSKAGLPAG